MIVEMCEYTLRLNRLESMWRPSSARHRNFD